MGGIYQQRMRRGDAPLPDNIHPPDMLPTITAVRGAPDGTFWVQRMGDITAIDPQAFAVSGYTDRIGGPRWDVFDSEGRYLGGVRVPDRFRVTRIADTAIVGVQKDDLDIERVVRLRINRP